MHAFYLHISMPRTNVQPIVPPVELSETSCYSIDATHMHHSVVHHLTSAKLKAGGPILQCMAKESGIGDGDTKKAEELMPFRESQKQGKRQVSAVFGSLQQHCMHYMQHHSDDEPPFHLPGSSRGRQGLVYVNLGPSIGKPSCTCYTYGVLNMIDRVVIPYHIH